jgi:hypothetical protein
MSRELGEGWIPGRREVRGEPDTVEDEEHPFADVAKDWQLAGWKPALRENGVPRARKRFAAGPGWGIIRARGNKQAFEVN